MTMSEDHICFRMLCFHVNQTRFMVSAANFMKVLFLTYDVVCSYEHDREHVAAFLTPYNRMGDYIHQLAHYMFAAGCRYDKVHQFTSSSASLEPWTGAPHLPSITAMSSCNSPSPYSSLSQVATQLSACISPRIAWHRHSWCSARHMPLKFRTTIPHPK